MLQEMVVSLHSAWSVTVWWFGMVSGMSGTVAEVSECRWCVGETDSRIQNRLEESIYFTVSQRNPIEIRAPHECFTGYQSESE